MSFIKGATLFFLGMTCVMVMTQALEVKSIATNAIQYISKVVLTASGTSASATGVYLDGVSGNGYFSGNVGIGVAASSAYQLNVIGTGKFLNNLLVSGYSFTSRIYVPIIMSPNSSPISFEDSSINNVEYLTATVINAIDGISTPSIISPNVSPISFNNSSLSGINNITTSIAYINQLYAAAEIYTPIIRSPNSSPISFEDSSINNVEYLTAAVVTAEIHAGGGYNGDIPVGTCTITVAYGIITSTTCE